MANGNAAAATLAYVVAFNLIFFVQELALVLSKALVPGLHPVLFHNNHDWTGNAPIAELLQGAGALAILTLAAITLVLRPRRDAVRLLLAWITFHGVVQSLAQAFAGAILPGNDVGRAMTYLGFGALERGVALALAVVVMAVVLPRIGQRLAEAGIGRGAALLAVMLGTVLVLPFRIPGSVDQVVIVPVAVALIGAGWLLVGIGTPARRAQDWRFFASSAVAMLIVFQLVLRPGIAV